MNTITYISIAIAAISLPGLSRAEFCDQKVCSYDNKDIIILSWMGADNCAAGAAGTVDDCGTVAVAGVEPTEELCEEACETTLAGKCMAWTVHKMFGTPSIQCFLMTECNSEFDGIPCREPECKSGYSCQACSFEMMKYDTSANAVHWSCLSDTSEFVIYGKEEAPDGTECRRPIQCEIDSTMTEDFVTCRNGQLVNSEGANVTDLSDVRCPCKPLDIYQEVGMDLVCEPYLQPVDGVYKMTVENCLLLCNGHFIYDIECTFVEGEAETRWLGNGLPMPDDGFYCWNPPSTTTPGSTETTDPAIFYV